MRLIPFLLLAACTADGPKRHDPVDSGDSGSPDTSDPDTGGGDTGDPGDPEYPPVDGCRAEAPAADRVRTAVVSFPYDERGRQAKAWGVFQLGVDGTLTDLGTRFEMGRAFGGSVTFTPDGEVGFAVQEDGSVGVFRVGEDGTVTVVQASFSGDFYASRVVVDPGGEQAFLVDGNWAENGGGVYRVAIDCETGELSGPERILTSKLAEDLLLTRWRLDRAVLVGRELGGTAAGPDAYLLDWSESPASLGGVDAFGDDEAMVPDAVLTHDERFALIGDNSEFSGLPNRVAVVELGDAAPRAVQVLEHVDDPVALVASPFDDVVLALNGYGNAIWILDYSPDAPVPFALRGELSTTGAAPQLPSSVVSVDRGSLAGLALITEVEGVRRVWMKGDGEVVDLGLTSIGDGYEGITGAVGVQP